MKRTTVFVKSVGMARCRVSGGKTIRVPVVPGIFKHPTVRDLRGMLKDSDVVRKYTLEALRVAPWAVLKQFPREWLKSCLPRAHVRSGRAKAIEFLLSQGI